MSQINHIVNSGLDIMGEKQPNAVKKITPAFTRIGSDYIANILKRFNLPIISVGSGSGKHEKELESKGLKIICVDPFQGIFKPKEIIRKPDHKMTIEEFAKKNLSIRENVYYLSTGLHLIPQIIITTIGQLIY